MIKTIVKRLLPLFLALVVVISLFPAVPALAEDVAPIADYTLSGVWTFKSRLSISEYISQKINFTSGGTSYVSIQVCPEDGRDFESDVVMYCTSGLCYQPYDGGWRDDWQTVDFGSTPQTVSSSFYNWFVSNATQQSPPEFVYTVNTDDEFTITFSSTEQSVDVELWVGEDGYICYFADNPHDGISVDYQVDGVLDDDHVFLGMSELASSQNPYYTPKEDEPYIIKLNSSTPTLNLYGIFVAAPDPDPIYYTHTILIDNSSFEFTAENAAPPVSIEVTSIGCSLKASHGSVVKSWIYSGTDTFIGIKAEDGTVYNVGSSFIVSGLLRADKASSFSVLTESDPDPEPSETYTHTIIIDGSSFVFDGESGAPPVTFDVRDDCVILICGDQQKTWYYQGSGTFLGIRGTVSGELYGPAAWFSLLGLTGSHKTSSFTVEVAAPEPDPTYYNTIYIDGVPYRLSGIGSSPDVQLTVHENGCILTSGSTSLTYLYSGTGTFTGLSFVAGTDPNLPIGTVIIIEGSSFGDSSIKLFACYDEVLPDQDEDFQGGVLGWLKYLSEKIRDLPGAIAKNMASAALPAPLQFIFSIFDFDSLRIFFVDMYHNVTSVFGLKTLIEDPAGPFAWLMAS